MSRQHLRPANSPRRPRERWHPDHNALAVWSEDARAGARFQPFALVTGATGGCLLHIPFSISTVRESQVQPPIDRNKQAP